MNPDYTTLMAQLKSGELDKIEIQPDQFMAFQTAYMAFESRKKVIGSAAKNGVITYRYDHDEG